MDEKTPRVEFACSAGNSTTRIELSVQDFVNLLTALDGQTEFLDKVSEYLDARSAERTGVADTGDADPLTTAKSSLRSAIRTTTCLIKIRPC